MSNARPDVAELNDDELSSIIQLCQTEMARRVMVYEHAWGTLDATIAAWAEENDPEGKTLLVKTAKRLRERVGKK